MNELPIVFIDDVNGHYFRAQRSWNSKEVALYMFNLISDEFISTAFMHREEYETAFKYPLNNLPLSSRISPVPIDLLF